MWYKSISAIAFNEYPGLLFLVIAATIGVQEAATAQGAAPGYINEVYFSQGDSLLDLEQSDGHVRNKVKAFGFGGSESIYELENERSHIRLKTADTLRFAMRTAGTFSDPSTVIKLYQLDVRKGVRVAVISAAGGTFGASKVRSGKGELSLRLQRSTDGSFYILMPASRLTPGEYGFMNAMSLKGTGTNIAYTFYTFGIDK